MSDATEPVVRVNILQAEGEQVLIEDVSTFRRVAVKRADVEALREGYGVTQSVFENGQPVGVAWESLDLPPVSPEGLAYQLRRHGLHTAADVRRAPGQVLAAVRAAYGPTVNGILQFIRSL